MLLSSRHIALFLFLTVILAMAASIAWEYGLEGVISDWLNIPYEAEFEDAERWRFILTSTAFAAIAQIIPGVTLVILVRRLTKSLRRIGLSEEKSRTLAGLDPLTGIANRRLLQQRMEDGFRSHTRLELLLIDLDRFKSVNETYGHVIGDRVISEVAGRLVSASGKGALVARFGGDEFAVLVDSDQDSAEAVASAIIALVNKPIEIDDLRISLGCSIGVCCTDDAYDSIELMKRADLALFEVKSEGGGNVASYHSGMLEVATERGLMEVDMRVAIEHNDFHLVYQPLLDLTTDIIFGYEALIRWDHPRHGPIPPVNFIPLAEKTGQIVAIGAWVLIEACRQAATWPKHVHVAVNISPAQFRSPLLIAHVTAALVGSGLRPGRLELELTETAMVEDGPAVRQVLAALRALGVTVAMDDFGTGFSSLAHLRDFPLDRIKIDRSFVSTAATDKQSMAILRAVAQLGQDLRIPTLGEGVETLEQLDLLRSIGCHAAQGYLIGMPTKTPRFTSELPARSA